MGCSFNTKIVPGTKTKDDIKKIFENLQDQDRHENGSMYSGGFGMARGLEFHESTIFKNPEDAADWLNEYCPKWGEARCVPFLDEGGTKQFMIGANCAS